MTLCVGSLRVDFIENYERLKNFNAFSSQQIMINHLNSFCVKKKGTRRKESHHEHDPLKDYSNYGIH